VSPAFSIERNAYPALMHAKQARADFMAECMLCGAFTVQPLEATWTRRSVACSNCGVHMPLDASVLDTLRAQAVAAQAAIDGLAG
jgi:transcription elongation factor Elf1